MIQQRPSRRPSGPWLVSLALHLVLGGVLAYTVDVPGRLGWWDQERAPAVPAERIGFLSIPQGPDEPGRSGGDGRPLVESPAPAPPPAPLVAPREVPTGIPEAPPAPAPAEQPAAGSGEVIGEGGPTAGIRPSLSTPRLYAPPGEPAFVAPRAAKPGKPTAAEIDREVRRRLGGINDSLAALPPQREPGDWTVEKGGRKWGVDQKKIYLGPVTLPTALLALLPLNVQGNPAEIERGRALRYQRQDIQYHAQRAANDEEFKAAVKRIRERKERERREAEQRGEQVETENAPVP